MGKLLSYNGYYLWKYIPSLPGAITFTVLFVIITVAHSWRMFRHRLWFCIPFTIGGIFEIIGYIGRALSSNATDKLGPFIIQSIFLLVAPAFFAASVYMVLGRLVVALHGEHYSLVAPRWLTKVFVLGDVVSFLVQASGAGIMVGGSLNSMTLGSHVVVGGLVVQVVMFGLFSTTAVLFHVRFRRYGPQTRGAATTVRALEDRGLPWERMLYMLYAVSLLIMVRSVFRVIEYVMGNDGYPLEHEWTLYVFDSVLMFGTMVIFFVRYPSNIRPPASLTPMLTVDTGMEMDWSSSSNQKGATSESA